MALCVSWLPLAVHHTYGAAATHPHDPHHVACHGAWVQRRGCGRRPDSQHAAAPRHGLRRKGHDHRRAQSALLVFHATACVQLGDAICWSKLGPGGTGLTCHSS